MLDAVYGTCLVRIEFEGLPDERISNTVYRRSLLARTFTHS